MPGLLDFLQSPQTALAAGLLTPTLNRKTGPALLQGLQAANTQEFSNQRNLAAKQAVAKAEQDAQQRKQTASLLQNFNGDLGQLATGLLGNPGTITQGISLLNAIKPESGRNPTKASLAFSAAGGDPGKALELLQSKSSDGSGTFRQPLADGSIGVYDSNTNTFIKRLEVDGDVAETFQSFKESNVAGRAQDRQQQSQQRIELAQLRLENDNTRLAQADKRFYLNQKEFEQTVSQQARTSARGLSADFEERVAPFRVQLRALDVLDSLLSGDVESLDNAVITNQLSLLSDSNVRAQANLNTFKNPGDLGTRLAGSLSAFFSGTRTQDQLDQARRLSKQLRAEVFAPALSSIEKAYRAVAKRSSLDPDNVVIKAAPNSIQEQIDAIDRELQGQ